MIVKLVKAQLKKWARERNYSRLEFWPLALGEIALAINRRIRRGQEFSSTDIFLGWSTRPMRLPEDHDLAIETLDSDVTGNEGDAHAGHPATMDRRDAIRWDAQTRTLDREDQLTPGTESHGFDAGQWVWERTDPSRNLKLRRFRRGQKREEHDDKRTPVFYPRWTGSWKITRVVSPVSVMIQDLEGVRRARKVQVNNLKRYTAGTKPGSTWAAASEDRRGIMALELDRQATLPFRTGDVVNLDQRE